MVVPAAHSVGAEARFRRSASMPMAEAKQRFCDWDAEVAGRIDRLRAMAEGTGIVLTQTEAYGLARDPRRRIAHRAIPISCHQGDVQHVRWRQNEAGSQAMIAGTMLLRSLSLSGRVQ